MMSQPTMSDRTRPDGTHPLECVPSLASKFSEPISPDEIPPVSLNMKRWLNQREMNTFSKVFSSQAPLDLPQCVFLAIASYSNILSTEANRAFLELDRIAGHLLKHGVGEIEDAVESVGRSLGYTVPLKGKPTSHLRPGILFDSIVRNIDKADPTDL
jgi:hypothetical protein